VSLVDKTRVYRQTIEKTRVEKTGYFSSRKNPAKKLVRKNPMRKPRRVINRLEDTVFIVDSVVVFLGKAKPRYLDMVSHFKATCKHRNLIEILI
jgi:hypothetical protein